MTRPDSDIAKPRSIPSLLRTVNQWLQTQVDKWLPTQCLFCRDTCTSISGICDACADDLPFLGPHCSVCALPLAEPGMCGQCIQSPPEYDCLRAIFRYDWPLNHMLLRLKNQGDLACGRTLSQLWVQHARTWKPNGVTLVPVPLHTKRWTQRRFNQAEVFATALSRAFGLPVLSILQRPEHTPPQSGLDRKQRRRNLKTAFAIQPQQAIPENVILVDDVVTTGSTIAACVHVLKKHGVRRIEVWALARTPAPA